MRLNNLVCNGKFFRHHVWFLKTSIANKKYSVCSSCKFILELWGSWSGNHDPVIMIKSSWSSHHESDILFCQSRAVFYKVRSADHFWSAEIINLVWENKNTVVPTYFKLICYKRVSYVENFLFYGPLKTL